jgi:hypothetical protein
MPCMSCITRRSTRFTSELMRFMCFLVVKGLGCTLFRIGESAQTFGNNVFFRADVGAVFRATYTRASHVSRGEISISRSLGETRRRCCGCRRLVRTERSIAHTCLYIINIGIHRTDYTTRARRAAEGVCGAPDPSARSFDDDPPRGCNNPPRGGFIIFISLAGVVGLSAACPHPALRRRAVVVGRRFTSLHFFDA